MANRLRNNSRFKSRNQQRISSGIKKRPGGYRNRNNSSKVMDARQKISSKKRNVRDARDILLKMGKTQDARSKLLKMREARNGESLTSSNIRAISTNIYKKTDRNGKISLITSKNKQSTSDINLAIQQQLGLIQNRKKVVTPRHSSSSSSVSPIARKGPARRVPSVLLSKTILNDEYHHSLPTYDSFPSHNYINSDVSSGVRMIGAPIITRRHQLRDYQDGNDWQPYSSFPSRGRLQPSGYVDLDAPDDEEMPLVSPVKQTIFMQGTSRSSNVHSRLDTNPIENQSHGIFSMPTKTKVVVPAGHRIVVSNLQQTVTQDDIRELFEDIGQLLAARLVRPGTAEVIYKNLKDAQKAVDTYHNRQLDGQPMKCLLVNKRPLNNPTGPALTTSKQDPTGLILAKKNTVAKTTEKLVPDLQTIHKVLFQRN